jgi:predicted transcriptional regulator
MEMPATMRISPSSWKSLKDIADGANESMQAILDKAIETYRRQWFLEQVNKGFAALKENPDAWREELEERAEWDVTLEDGLEGDE